MGGFFGYTLFKIYSISISQYVLKTKLELLCLFQWYVKLILSAGLHLGFA